MDAHGEEIVKGRKSHKISFADELDGGDKSLEEVKEVESYKQYNQTSYQDGQPGCSCNIL